MMGYWIECYSGFSFSIDIYFMVILGGFFVFVKGWCFYVEVVVVFQIFNNFVLFIFNFFNYCCKGMFEFGIMVIFDI